jgi:hypothetical protein
MTRFTVRCVEVSKKKPALRKASRIDTFFRGQSNGEGSQVTTPPVKAKATGPLSWVTLLGFFLSLSLFIVSIVLGDGMSLLATLLLSGLSSLIGLANKWELKLPKRYSNNSTSPGDVVIRYPNGSYLVVKCSEEVARELFFAPEEIEYNISDPVLYRMISLAGTILLMFGIIFLANAKLQLQFAWAASYMIINAAHWIAAAVPTRLHWDLSCYIVEEHSLVGGPNNKVFTEALWKAILISKSSRWVRTGDAAPRTPVWDAWLKEAEIQAKLCSSHKGPLIDPLWPSKNGPSKNYASGTIYEVPTEWNAKEAWDKLQDEANEAEKRGTMHPERVV